MTSANNNDVTNAELLEFLQEHMLTKEDGEKFATKEDLRKGIDRVMARFYEIDRELEDIKDRLDKIEMRLKEDVDATVSEIQKLKTRVGALERELGIRQVALTS